MYIYIYIYIVICRHLGSSLPCRSTLAAIFAKMSRRLTSNLPGRHDLDTDTIGPYPLPVGTITGEQKKIIYAETWS